MIARAAAKWAVAAMLFTGATALSVEFVSQHSDSELEVSWVGPSGNVPMGKLAPLESLRLQEVGNGHAFAVTDTTTGRSTTYYARDGASNYFVLAPGASAGKPINVSSFGKRGSA